MRALDAGGWKHTMPTHILLENALIGRILIDSSVATRPREAGASAGTVAHPRPATRYNSKCAKTLTRSHGGNALGGASYAHGTAETH